MTKNNFILVFAAIVFVVLLCGVYFSMQKSPLDVTYVPPNCDPSKTDCSKLTPDGTPFVRPPAPDTKATTTQVGQIDEHLFIDDTLKNVEFCGKNSRVKQIVINGVDVIQRIAELLRSDQFMENGKVKQGAAAEFCKPFIGIVADNKQASSSEIITSNIQTWSNSANGHMMYSFSLSSSLTFQFAVDASSGDIFGINGYSGDLYGPVGKLHK